jgi:putative spermidine/putrescine transport system substrate-binding protein
MEGRQDRDATGGPDPSEPMALRSGLAARRRRPGERWAGTMKTRALVALLVMTALLVPAVAGAASRSITVSTWGGMMTKVQTEAFFKPFTEKTGIEVKVTESSSEITAKIKAQAIQNTPDIDLACGIGAVESLLVSKEGYLLPIDYSKIPNAKNVLPEAKGEFILGAYVLSTNIAYNKQFFPNGGPKNMQEFFDAKKFPGPRGIKGFSAYGTLESALIADGVSRDKLYPLDVERAYRKLSELKPSVSIFYNTGAQQTQSLIDKEAYLGHYYIGRALAAKDAGIPLALEFQDGYLNIDYWVVPKTVRDKAAVHEFLNFVLEPEREAIFSKAMKYGPVNRNTINAIPAELQLLMNTHPENLKKQFWLNDEYWSGRYKQLNEQYMQWVSRK